MTPIDVETIQRVFARALFSDSFERIGARRGVWDVSRDCDRPVPVVMHSRATGLAKAISRKGFGPVPGIELVMLTPCRRCRVCLAKKARLWRNRAVEEIASASRTWFGTLTCHPEAHVWIDHVCATRERDFWAQPSDKKFAAQSRVLGTEVTKYLKRVRKNSGCRFRYLLVTEKHQSAKTSDEMYGRPHLHVLLHEFAGQPVRKHFLDDAWHHGFCQWRLVDGVKAAWYVSKYISKAQDARVRASLHYGNTWE